MNNREEVEGSACTVTSGPNAGKTGTYTRDDDGNLWCEGPWGGTECTGGKCADAKASEVKIFEGIDKSGRRVFEVKGLIEVPGRGIFDCRARVDADSGAELIVEALPIAAKSIDDLRKSNVELEQKLAELIATHLKG